MNRPLAKPPTAGSFAGGFREFERFALPARHLRGIDDGFLFIVR